MLKYLQIGEFHLDKILITTGANLNDYQAAGMYYCNNNVAVATISNRHTDSAFSLFVEKHAGGRQNRERNGYC